MKNELVKFENLSIEARTEVIKESMESTLWAFEKTEKEVAFLRARLYEQKQAVGHGNWQKWVFETFGDDNGATLRKLQRFMREPKTTLLSFLPETTESEPLSNAEQLAPRSERKTGQVEVSQVGQTADQSDDDPTPAPPTNRKTSSGSRKVSEADKPKTQPVQAELLPEEDPEPSDPIQEWIETHTLSDLVTLVVAKTCNSDDTAARKKAAKQLRKLADELDPPDESPKPEKVPTIGQLIRAIPDDVGALREVIEKWARHKQSLQGKARVRSMESWQTMIEQMLKACDRHGVTEVSESIRASMANGYTGWDIQLKSSNGKVNGNGNYKSREQQREQNNADSLGMFIRLGEEQRRIASGG